MFAYEKSGGGGGQVWQLATILERCDRDTRPMAGALGGDLKPTSVCTASPEAEEDNRRIMRFKRERIGVGTLQTRDHMKAKSDGKPSPLIQSQY
ncbi:hypothetical protein RHMOL_Rhmol01G0044300 [Rhododendron molle]|uniref:Uncharacterized protein n=1 Tax=Rhododendron molle TaxID=49168 RepID=A0ACC0PXT3_RHOML|nr:hypothetical protein RHMOL_Rhmol01G0044300 [Rhododendron molle]